MRSDINEIFNECVEEIRKGRSVEECLRMYQGRRDELEPLLKAVGRFMDEGSIKPSASRKQQSKDRLMQAVERKRWEAGIERVPAAGRRARKQAFRPRLALARMGVVTLVFIMLSGATLAMAQESLPGSPLYPVKLAVEKARIGLALDDKARGDLYIKAALTRMSELEQLDQDDPRYRGLLEAASNSIVMAERLSAESDDPKAAALLEGTKARHRELIAGSAGNSPASAGRKATGGAGDNRAGADTGDDTQKTRKPAGDAEQNGAGSDDGEKARYGRPNPAGPPAGSTWERSTGDKSPAGDVRSSGGSKAPAKAKKYRSTEKSGSGTERPRTGADADVRSPAGTDGSQYPGQQGKQPAESGAQSGSQTGGSDGSR